MKTLIIFASKHGSTDKCAQMLAQKLKSDVKLCNLKGGSAPELSEYDRVIIGSPVYAGNILKEVKDFCTSNMDELGSKKVGLFICCMNKEAAQTQLNAAFPKELSENCIIKESFGGEFKFREMNFMEKAITRMVTKMLSKNDPSLGKIDMKNDLSMLSLEKLESFAQMMNKA
jgi:menaquinone-dependent protoporphyrinogen oxidase